VIRSHLIFIYRNFKRSKTSLLINLVGLSIGLVSTLLIYLWIIDELTIDTFNENDGRLYQVMRNEPLNSRINTEEYTPGLLARSIGALIPEVEDAVAVVPPTISYKGVISAGDSKFYTTPQFADKDFFKLFTYQFIEGNKNTVLLDKNAISISEDLAIKLYKTTKNTVGKTVQYENEYFAGQYIIAGVFKSQSTASTKFDVLFSYDLFLDRRPEVREWSNGGPSTFLVLKEGAALRDIDNKITAVLHTKRPGTKETLFLQRFSERYLYGNYSNGVPIPGKIIYVRLLGVIALFILGIACINFMNLSTAKASRRMKEVGVKKVIGASRAVLMIQYIAESMLLTFISLFVALLATELLLPQFNLVTGKSLVLHFDLKLILALLTISLLTGLIAGCYPAIYLSGFNPANALKGKLSATNGELLTRKGLIVFQFIISIILILSVLVTYNQIKYVKTKYLGYEKDNVISFAKQGKLDKNFKSFLFQLKNTPGVVNASYMYGSLAGGVSSRSSGLTWDGQSFDQKNAKFDYLDVDFGLIETLNLKVEQGRSFSPEYGSDTAAIIFNKAAIKEMGIKDPIGKVVNFYGNRQIIGIVDDFHFESLFEKVKPFFFKIDYEDGGNILVRIKSGSEKIAIENIGKLYKEFNDGVPFEYKFLDEDYQVQYAFDNKVAILSRYFAGIAILISCLGLFGLAAFMVERRSKEIAIRKTLGCSDFGILSLLSTFFVRIILVAIFVAFPIGYLIMGNWLETFAYRISLQWWYFAFAGLLAFIMAWMAIASQIFIAIRINPVKYLKE
jgi:putative ABC transport system permease protein